LVVVAPDSGAAGLARSFAKRLNNAPVVLLDKRREEANQASIIFNEQLPPVDGIAGNNLSIRGTAQLLVGPESTVQFEGYKVFYSPDPENINWINTDGLHLQEVLPEEQ